MFFILFNCKIIQAFLHYYRFNQYTSIFIQLLNNMEINSIYLITNIIEGRSVMKIELNNTVIEERFHIK